MDSSQPNLAFPGVFQPKTCAREEQSGFSLSASQSRVMSSAVSQLGFGSQLLSVLVMHSDTFPAASASCASRCAVLPTAGLGAAQASVSYFKISRHFDILGLLNILIF